LAAEFAKLYWQQQNLPNQIGGRICQIILAAAELAKSNLRQNLPNHIGS
jgi:hypothetical protein